jgi:hypothetical protein
MERKLATWLGSATVYRTSMNEQYQSRLLNNFGIVILNDKSSGAKLIHYFRLLIVYSATDESSPWFFCYICDISCLDKFISCL